MTFRKFAITFVICLLVGCTSAGLMGANGCAAKQQTTADLLIIAGNSTEAYCASIGDSACVAGAQKFSGIVSADIANFVPGTNSQDAIQAIQDFEAVIAAVDPSGKLSILDLALSAALSALQVIEANTGTIAPAATVSVQARINSAQTVAIQNPPKTAAEYKQKWNALLKANPVPGLKPLK